MHLVSKYAHIKKAFISIEKLRWTRIRIGETDTKGHPHSFYRDGDDKKIVRVEIDASGGGDKLVAKVEAGISDLLGAVNEIRRPLIWIC